MPIKKKSVLKELGFVKSNTEALKAFERYIAEDFRTIEEMSPSKYIVHCYNKYKTSTGAINNSLNGNIFELIVETCLYRENIKPMFLQAKVTFVPNVKFDVLLYTDDQYPITISLKTSTRERYKQADLEAVALKYVHRRALNYLVMLSSDETTNLKNKLKKGELLGLNEIIAADKDEFDILVNKLKSNSYINPGKVDVVIGSIVK